jgi:hypothetical protein
MNQVRDRPKQKTRKRVFLESGIELTPELEDELVAEAERGYDLSKFRRHYLTRPLLADSDTGAGVAFPLSSAELDALRARAEKESRPLGDLVREALDS